MMHAQPCPALLPHSPPPTALELFDKLDEAYAESHLLWQKRALGL